MSLLTSRSACNVALQDPAYIAVRHRAWGSYIVIPNVTGTAYSVEKGFLDQSIIFLLHPQEGPTYTGFSAGYAQ